MIISKRSNVKIKLLTNLLINYSGTFKIILYHKNE